jgi:hypothetical protein
MSRLFVDRISPYQSGSVTVDGLNIDTGSLVTTASFNAYTSSNDSKVNSLISATSSYATTGGNNFTGDQDINGGLTISGAATYDIDVTGKIKIGTTNTAELFVSSSTGNASVTPRYSKILASGGAGVDQSIIYGGYFSTYQADHTEIAICADASSFGTGWSNGPALVNNDPGDNYPAVIGFQDKTNYTDNRATFLTPVQLNNVLELAQQDPLPAGSVGQLSVSGSNLYYHNGSSWSQIN